MVMTRNFSNRFLPLLDVELENAHYGDYLNPEVAEVTSETEKVLDVIFSEGSDGYPNRDLATYVNKNTRPEIRQFIEQQLLRETQTEKGSFMSSEEVAQANKLLTDDDIANYTRWDNEPVADYSARMRKEFFKQYNLSKNAKRKS